MRRVRVSHFGQTDEHGGSGSDAAASLDAEGATCLSRRLTIDVVANGTPLLAPLPFNGLQQRLTGFEVEGAKVVETIRADSGQEALLLQPHAERLLLHFSVQRNVDAELPQWFWHSPSNSLSDASPELVQFVRDMKAPSAAETVRRLAAHVTSTFYYGAGQGRFTDGRPSVPLVCGTTRGTCVDIHTYFSAALRAAGIRAAYVAGIFIREDAAEATDMHCWVAVHVGDEIEQWDLSHALIAGREPRPGLTEIPGRRVALSSGRGLRFATRGHSCELSHLSLPCDFKGKVLPAHATIEAI